MPTPADLVYQTTTDVGTGNLVLSSVNGKRTFADAFGTGVTLDVFDYYISNNGVTGSSNAEFEIGTGHMSDATTLVRDTVSRSTNSATFNATISGTTLTVVGSVTSGTIAAGQFLYWTGQTAAPPKIVSGSNPTWTISSTQTLATSTPITAYGPVSLTTGIKDITNDVPAALQVRTSTNTVTDGHGVVFNGTSGNLIKSLGSAPQPLNSTLTSLGGLALASGDTLYATAASTLAKLAAGTNGNVLKLASNLPSWGLPFVVNLTTFTTSGTYTPPTGLIGAIVICTGGGGGGGAASNMSTTRGITVAAGGGAGGGTGISFLTAAQIPTATFTGTISGTTLTVTQGSVIGTIAVGQIISGGTIAANTTITAGSNLSWTVSVSQTVSTATSITALPFVSIGAGGTRGVGSASTTTAPTNGGAGTTTSFLNNLVVGNGGGGGGAPVFTSASNSGVYQSFGGAGGTGTGTLAIKGQDGGFGSGSYVTNASSLSGEGGSTFWGSGGIQQRRLYAASSAAAVAGYDGIAYGSGGGGALFSGLNSSLVAANGGIGASGVCAIFEFYAP